MATEGTSASRSAGRSVLQDQGDEVFELIVNPSLLQGNLGTLENDDIVVEPAATSVVAEEESFGNVDQSRFYYAPGDDDD